MTHRDEDEEIIDSALDTLAWQRREIDRLKAALAKIADLGRWTTMTEGCNAATDAVSIARAALGEKQ